MSFLKDTDAAAVVIFRGYEKTCCQSGYFILFTFASQNVSTYVLRKIVAAAVRAKGGRGIFVLAHVRIIITCNRRRRRRRR